LICDSRQRAHYNHRLLILATALADGDQAPNGSLIFHRGASELHDHNVVILIESALSLAHGIQLHSEVLAQRKTHRQIASGGGFG
jgi:hypothetical protein